LVAPLTKFQSDPFALPESETAQIVLESGQLPTPLTLVKAIYASQVMYWNENPAFAPVLPAVKQRLMEFSVSPVQKMVGVATFTA
jgi:hypothetical protein